MLKKTLLIIYCLLVFQNVWAYSCPSIFYLNDGAFPMWEIYPPEGEFFGEVQGPLPGGRYTKMVHEDFLGATADNHNNYIENAQCKYDETSNSGNKYSISAVTKAGNYFKPNKNWVLNQSTNKFECRVQNREACGFD